MCHCHKVSRPLGLNDISHIILCQQLVVTYLLIDDIHNKCANLTVNYNRQCDIVLWINSQSDDVLRVWLSPSDFQISNSTSLYCHKNHTNKWHLVHVIFFKTFLNVNLLRIKENHTERLNCIYSESVIFWIALYTCHISLWCFSW